MPQGNTDFTTGIFPHSVRNLTVLKGLKFVRQPHCLSLWERCPHRGRRGPSQSRPRPCQLPQRGSQEIAKFQFDERFQSMREKSKGTVQLIGRDRTPVNVCDVINGKPKVKQRVKGDYIEFVLRYSLFHKETRDTIKRLLKK